MEYGLLIIEFFVLKGWRSLVDYLLPPIVIGLLIYYRCDNDNYTKYAGDFHTNLVTVLSILVGFTISTFTMLLTISNLNIDKAKTELINKKVFSRELSLYDSVLIGLAYTIFIQCLLLIANFLYPVFVEISSQHGKFLFALNIAIMIHIILILLRSILDFYFILTKRGK